MAFTTTDLLAAIARRSFAPVGQATFTAAELLAIADEVMETVVVPDIHRVREEYYGWTKNHALVASQAAYDVPARAFGLTVRDVWLIDSAGNLTDLPQIEPNEAASSTPGSPAAFYLRGNQIVLHPAPASASGTLRLPYFLSPGLHVATDAAGVISSIDTGTNTVVVATIPAAWATGSIFDLVKQDGGQEPLDIDLTSTLVTGSSITLPSLPTGLRVGDYVCLAGQTALPFLPALYRAVLAQAVAAQILSDMNQPGAEAASKKVEIMLKTARDLIAVRVQGEDRVITPVNWF